MFRVYSYGLVQNSLWASSLSSGCRSVRDFVLDLWHDVMMLWLPTKLIFYYTQSVLHKEGTITTESTIDYTHIWKYYTCSWRESQCKDALGSLSGSETHSEVRELRGDSPGWLNQSSMKARVMATKPLTVSSFLQEQAGKHDCFKFGLKILVKSLNCCTLELCQRRGNYSQQNNK